MDLNEFKGKLILHVIDHATRFSAATFVTSRHKEEIIGTLFKIWISVFGTPSKFFSDKGGEFSKNHFNERCELLNIIFLKNDSRITILKWTL